MFDDIDKKQTATPAVGNQPAVASQPAVKTESQPAQAGDEAEIHTMPMEYYLGPKTAELTKGERVEKKAVPTGGAPGTPNKKKIFNIAVVAVLAFVVAGSAYLMFRSYEQPAPLVAKPEITVAPVKTVPVETAPVATEPALPVEPEKKPVEPAKFNPAEIKKFNLSLMSGPDKDKDGLTDAEEALFGMNANLNDSDGDVYKDKEEIVNFYSPVDKGKVRLWEKDFVKYYTNKNYGYKILYPASWLVQPLDENDPKDLMVSSNQNEFVNIVVLDKEPIQTLEEWYLALAPEVKKESLKKHQTFNKLAVVESPDAFTVYIENEENDKVFAVNYNIGLKEVASFPIVFQMIVNSFQFVPLENAFIPVTAPAATPNVEAGELPAGE